MHKNEVTEKYTEREQWKLKATMTSSKPAEQMNDPWESTFGFRCDGEEMKKKHYSRGYFQILNYLFSKIFETPRSFHQSVSAIGRIIWPFLTTNSPEVIPTFDPFPQSHFPPTQWKRRVNEEGKEKIKRV